MLPPCKVGRGQSWNEGGEERIGDVVLIPVWFQGSYFGTETLKSLVLHFLQQ